MKVTVLFFGAAKDAVGAETVELDFPPQISAAEAFQQILQVYPALPEKFGKSLLFAVNQNYASGDETVRNGDELAIFPPVSGGSGENQKARNEIENRKSKIENRDGFYELTFEPLNVGDIARRAVPPTCGAIVTLDGFVREWTRGKQTEYLVYEAYEPMALTEMQKLGAAACEKFEIAHVAIVHRLGRLEIGETSVVISVAAPHRRAAFEACEWLIKELKRTVPIWKKEFYAGGSDWIEGETR
ncbi:MAG: molybdenum cofactor biosynthesis protein MoaE [Acidobacteriota bacterium]|nr:molybdenum cofactor biosynthesis protein MoaE [Acidobacteriota bacterium]